MDNKVIENRNLIAKFNIEKYLNEKKYEMASSLSALDTTNDIEFAYILGEAKTEEENSLRLYALLQALFVAIDSLYQLAYSLTNSKNFININSNETLRELKYIRNDVVGHPANRVLNQDRLAYCILDTKSIRKESFKYNIFSLDKTIEKEVDIYKLLDSYYDEANSLLKKLYNLSNQKIRNEEVILLLDKVLNDYYNYKDIRNDLNAFENEYKNSYKEESNNSRILWRLSIIKELLDFNIKSKELESTSYYTLGLLLSKIYGLLNGIDLDSDTKMKKPKIILNIYRFFNKREDLVYLLKNIKDISNPRFYLSLEKLYNIAIEADNQSLISYLKLLIGLYKNNKLDLLYAFVLPLNNYIRK